MTCQSRNKIQEVMVAQFSANDKVMSFASEAIYISPSIRRGSYLILCKHILLYIVAVDIFDQQPD